MTAALLLLPTASCSGAGPAPEPVAGLSRSPSTAAGSPRPSPSPTPSRSPSLRRGDWPTYHRDVARTGFDPATPAVHRLAPGWTTGLDGAVFAEPLVVGGSVLAATENDSIYALDAGTGRIRWRTHVGTPVPLSRLPCGNIDPLGITGTPAYDPGTGLVFAVAETTGFQHLLVGLDVTTGALRVRRPVEPPVGDRRAHQQRAALAVSRGRVYVAYGGLAGDCGHYVGSVVAARTDGTGPQLSWHVPTPREGGIWAPSGPAVDGAGNLYVAVGNGASTSAYDGSDSVTELSPTLRRLGLFAPVDWSAHNAADADLGSAGPALLPGGLVFVDGKSRTGYLLRAGGLGGIGAELARTSGCRSFGGDAVAGSLLLVPCTDGLRALRVGPGARLRPAWRGPPGVDGPPVAGGSAAFALDTSAGRLYALALRTGRVLGTASVGRVPHFATPTVAGRAVYVGTSRGVTMTTVS